MKLIRFVSNSAIYTGTLVDAATAMLLEWGDRAGPRYMPIDKLLAPLVPTDILCIGLNYREHAAESGSAIPENPCCSSRRRTR